MHLPSLLILAVNSCDSACHDLLFLLGIALIVHVLFKGIKSLRPQADSPLSPQLAPAPLTTAPLTPAPEQPAPMAGGITPEIIAVIAAAVATTCGPNRRVISIKRPSSHWEKAGRQAVLSSHRIR